MNPEVKFDAHIIQRFLEVECDAASKGLTLTVHGDHILLLTKDNLVICCADNISWIASSVGGMKKLSDWIEHENHKYI